MHDAARGRVAGVQEIRRPAVVAFLAGHRADNRQFFGNLGNIDPMLGDADARHGSVNRLGRPLRLGAWFRVERLELTRTAGHPEQNARPALLAELVSVDAHAVEPVQAAQRSGTDTHPAQKPTPAHSAVGVYADIHASAVVVRHGIIS